MTPSREALADPARFVEVARFVHTDPGRFIRQWLRPSRPYWLWNAAQAAVVGLALATAPDLLRALGLLATGFLLSLGLLPAHEGVHALAYRALGARDVRFELRLRKGVVYTLADGFVLDGRGLLVVALAPSVVLNGVLLVLWTVVPRWGPVLGGLLWGHLFAAMGDVALVCFAWAHRRTGAWTVDVAGESIFWTRAGSAEDPDAARPREVPRSPHAGWPDPGTP